jgi:hypothetical protein
MKNVRERENGKSKRKNYVELLSVFLRGEDKTLFCSCGSFEFNGNSEELGGEVVGDDLIEFFVS